MGLSPGSTCPAAARRLAAAGFTLLVIACHSGGGSSPAPAPTTYTVTYSGNGSTGGSVPTDPGTYAQGATVTVLGNTGSLVKTGSSFSGWNSVAGGTGTAYSAGQTFTMGTAAVTLYAQWAAGPATYTVTYNGNGNTGGSVPVDSATYQQGATVTVLGNTGGLVKTGDTFGGWNTAAGGSGTAYAAGATFPMGTANVNLYAQWPVTTNLGFAYVVNQYTNGTAGVSQFAIGPNGALSSLTPATVDCGNIPFALTADPSGKYVYVANEEASPPSISQYTIGTNGALTPMSPATVVAGGYPHSVVVHPSGKYAYVADNQSANISQYTIGSTGALSPMAIPTVTAVAAPDFLAVHPTGKAVYLTTGGSGNTVLQYSVDPLTGALAPMTAPSIDAGSNAYSIAIHPSGKWAYVTNYYTGDIFEYTIDSTTGALSHLAKITAAGFASWITTDPSGKYAYVANAAGATPAIFQYTIGTDGTLTAMSPASVNATSAATCLQVDATGSYLYMTSGTSGSGNTVSQFKIGTNGVLTAMSPATALTGSGPNAIVIVNK
jgi:uncharacterized repeat protein (TIGR02543 family)